MKLPKRFRLHGNTIEVTHVPSIFDEHNALGRYVATNEQIMLAPQSASCKVAAQTQQRVFCHELVHAILHHMSNELYEDEVFVDSFARLLHQALVTMEYK